MTFNRLLNYIYSECEEQRAIKNYFYLSIYFDSFVGWGVGKLFDFLKFSCPPYSRWESYYALYAIINNVILQGPFISWFLLPPPGKNALRSHNAQDIWCWHFLSNTALLSPNPFVNLYADDPWGSGGRYTCHK